MNVSEAEGYRKTIRKFIITDHDLNDEQVINYDGIPKLGSTVTMQCVKVEFVPVSNRFGHVICTYKLEGGDDNE